MTLWRVTVLHNGSVVLRLELATLDVALQALASTLHALPPMQHHDQVHERSRPEDGDAPDERERVREPGRPHEVCPEPLPASTGADEAVEEKPNPFAALAALKRSDLN